MQTHLSPHDYQNTYLMFLDYFNFLHFALGNVHLSFTVQTSTAEGLEEEKVAKIYLWLNNHRIDFALNQFRQSIE